MATATGDYKLLIGGEWVRGSGGAYGVVNPATEEIDRHAPEATAADAEAAAQAARDAPPAVEAHDAGGAGQPAPGARRRDAQAQRPSCCR